MRLPRNIHVPVKLTLKDRIALEKTQREYRELCIDFAGEVIDLLGGVDGNDRLLKQARQELASDVADAIAGFIVRHSQ